MMSASEIYQYIKEYSIMELICNLIQVAGCASLAYYTYKNGTNEVLPFMVSAIAVGGTYNFYKTMEKDLVEINKTQGPLNCSATSSITRVEKKRILYLQNSDSIPINVQEVTQVIGKNSHNRNVSVKSSVKVGTDRQVMNADAQIESAEFSSKKPSAAEIKIKRSDTKKGLSESSGKTKVYEGMWMESAESTSKKPADIKKASSESSVKSKVYEDTRMKSLLKKPAAEEMKKRKTDTRHVSSESSVKLRVDADTQGIQKRKHSSGHCNVKETKNDALPTIPKVQINIAGDDSCAICNDTLKNRTTIALKCGHVFHEICIDIWLIQDKENVKNKPNGNYKEKGCPLCGKVIDISRDSDSNSEIFLYELLMM